MFDDNKYIDDGFEEDNEQEAIDAAYAAYLAVEKQELDDLEKNLVEF